MCACWWEVLSRGVAGRALTVGMSSCEPIIGRQTTRFSQQVCLSKGSVGGKKVGAMSTAACQSGSINGVPSASVCEVVSWRLYQPLVYPCLSLQQSQRSQSQLQRHPIQVFNSMLRSILCTLHLSLPPPLCILPPPSPHPENCDAPMEVLPCDDDSPGFAAGAVDDPFTAMGSSVRSCPAN